MVRPASVEEVAEVVRRAAAAGQAVYPFCGRTMLDYGLPPQRPGIGIDLRALDQVIDYPARDMTITVQAGITVARLQEILRAENQQLPIDVPCADRATLGGALATNVSGPRRYGYGTLRDYVLGISVVNDEGRETKAGGRVVKNVAGYDLCKLYVGALGTLGVITQATLKHKPLPEAQALLSAGVARGEEVAPVLDALHESQTRPVYIELLNEAATRALNPRLGDAPGWSLIVGYDGNAAAVGWQTEQCRRELSSELVPDLAVRTSDDGGAIRQALTDFPVWPEAAVTFKANLLPSATAGFCRRAEELSDRLLLQAHAGNGIVIGHLPGTWQRNQAEVILKALLKTAAAGQGNLVLLRCPDDWRRTIPTWGAPRDDWELMRRVKQQLDPRDVFNPGRFV
jgi:glycolate oxidase FAD binding subunit